MFKYVYCDTDALWNITITPQPLTTWKQNEFELRSVADCVIVPLITKGPWWDPGLDRTSTILMVVQSD